MKNERNKSGQTELLYETDGMLFDFTARVISCKQTEEGGYALILDRTAFFPEGGGQPADTGTINGVKITDVRTDDEGCVIHYAEDSLSEGMSVEGHIDGDKRMSRMQNHGAEHLLCGLIHNRFGYENVGFHMSADEVTFDVDGPLTDEEIEEIEIEANRVIYRNVPIKISFPTVEEAVSLNYRSKLDTYENIRLVEIEGYDICACCAPHLATTGQIGVVKILTAMPHRQGTRMTLVAGIDAYGDYSNLHKANGEIMALLSSKREKTAEFVKDLLERNSKMREETTALKKEMTNLISESVLGRIQNRDEGDTSPELIFTESLDAVGLRNLINTCTEQFGGIVAGFLGNDETGYRYIIGCSRDENLPELAKKLNKECNGKGGGNKQMVQGSLTATRKHIVEIFR